MAAVAAGGGRGRLRLPRANARRRELVRRQLQLAEKKLKDRRPAYRDTGGSNSYAYFFSGLADTRGLMVTPALSRWIAEQLSSEAAIAEERRTSREERRLVRPQHEPV